MFAETETAGHRRDCFGCLAESSGRSAGVSLGHCVFPGPGLGSNRSTWLGPPDCISRMMDLRGRVNGRSVALGHSRRDGRSRAQQSVGVQQMRRRQRSGRIPEQHPAEKALREEM